MASLARRQRREQQRRMDKLYRNVLEHTRNEIKDMTEEQKMEYLNKLQQELIEGNNELLKQINQDELRMQENESNGTES